TFRSGLRVRSGHTDVLDDCHALLREYIEVFRDPHLAVAHHTSAAGAPETDAAIRARFADWPMRSISEAAARELIDGRNRRLDPIEGIWEIVNADYRLAVLADDTAAGRYHAITLRADGVW